MCPIAEFKNKSGRAPTYGSDIDVGFGPVVFGEGRTCKVAVNGVVIIFKYLLSKHCLGISFQKVIK